MSRILDAIEAVVGDVRVARTAAVTRVYDDGRVDVQPLVAEPVWALGEQRWELPPVLPALPVQWWRSGGAAITGRLRRDDVVLVLVRDLDHADADREQAGERPTSSRRWDLSDAVVLAGFTPAGGWPSGSLPTDARDLVAYMEGGGVLYVGSAAAALLLARADLVFDQLQSLATALSTHTHGGVTPGTGTSEAPAMAPYIAPATAADIASDRVRVDS